MPICIPKDLPAFQILENENIFIMDNERASHQDIRPLRVLLLNLMPKKIETECQFLRLLSNTPIQVNVEFLQVSSHISKNTCKTHLDTFYHTFDEIQDNYYDGCIITGAPVEHLDFDTVDYWKELQQIMEWTKTHVFSTMHICWGALAGLYYHFDIPKYDLPEKMFGIFEHKVQQKNIQLLRGFDDCFYAPHSRLSEVRKADIDKIPQLTILTESEQAGVHIVANKNGRQYFVTGHFEYDRMTLSEEYWRDRNKGIDIAVPHHYFPDDNPDMPPLYTWGCSANLLFSNWINHCVYQPTPYDLQCLELYNWNWEAGL